ncbi:hypothetical protein TNCV_1450731 [Trichonephila clavipes]|nr:hypothetical protein TNCV_1450731 [Trichonephila clavipes]
MTAKRTIEDVLMPMVLPFIREVKLNALLELYEQNGGFPLVSAKIHYQIGDGGSIADPYPCDVKKREEKNRKLEEKRSGVAESSAVTEPSPPPSLAYGYKWLFDALLLHLHNPAIDGQE